MSKLIEQLLAEAAPSGERLQKVLARAGIGSRRTCEELIVAGRVLVNGEKVVLGCRVDIEADKIEVDGAQLNVRADAVYYLLNKPKGVVSTADDPQGRQTVVQLVPSEPRVFPVGRLDVDTEGLLLLTNDGELTFRITHPSFGLPKEYLAEVEGDPTPGALRKLRQGVELEDGKTAPATASRLSAGVIKLTIHEGRNRQVRRMLEAVGFPVKRLVRTRIGPLRESKLVPGTWRALTSAEVRSLERAVATSANDAAGDSESAPVVDVRAKSRGSKAGAGVGAETAAKAKVTPSRSSSTTSTAKTVKPRSPSPVAKKTATQKSKASAEPSTHQVSRRASQSTKRGSSVG